MPGGSRKAASSPKALNPSTLNRCKPGAGKPPQDRQRGGYAEFGAPGAFWFMPVSALGFRIGDWVLGLRVYRLGFKAGAVKVKDCRPASVQGGEGVNSVS